MTLHRTFTHYRVVATVPASLRHWIAGIRADAPPFGEWPADLQVVFQDVRTPGIDLDRAVEDLRAIAIAAGPVRGRPAGCQIIPRGEDFALALTVDLDPDLPGLRHLLPVEPPVRAERDAAIVPLTARPSLILVEDLGPAEVEPVRRAFATRPEPSPFPIDRVQILGTSGRAGWWHEIASVRLGGQRASENPERGLLRHAGGWRLAG